MLRFARFLCLLLLLVSVLSSRAVFAADTVETFDVGATDVDFYVGVDGLGNERYEKTLYTDMMLGYGLIPGFSAYFGAAGESNECFGDGSGNLYFGVYGTPLDSDHVDLDLFLGSDIAPGAFSLMPSLELNFDLEPDLALWGVYVRLGEVLTGRDTSLPDDEETVRVDESRTRFQFAPVTELTFGTYWTVAEGHQLLLEYDMAFAHRPDEGERGAEIGGLALGYNVALGDAIEMINHLALDLPQGGENLSVGIGTGIIVTLPSMAGK